MRPHWAWAKKDKGFTYKNKALNPDGIDSLKFKQGLVDGDTQIQIKGKGTLLDDPSFTITQPVTVQFHNSDGICWEAVYSAPASKNTAGPPGAFKDKSG